MDSHWSLIEEAEAAHRTQGYDFGLCLDHFFTYGYVFKTTEYFVMAEEAIDEVHGPFWFLWWASYRGGRGLVDLIKLMPYDLSYVAFYRAFRNNPGKLRFIETEKLKKRLNANLL